MYKASLLKFADLSVDTPTKINDDLSLMDIKYQGNPLFLNMHGIAASNVFPPNEKFNSPAAFSFKPDQSDLPNLTALEEMLEQHEIVQHLTLHKTFGRDLKINIKLKKNKNGDWVFTSNVNPFKPEELIQLNTQLSVTLKPGFYLSKETYGLYFTLDNITFDVSKPSAIQPVTLKIGTKKRQPQAVAS